MPRPVTVEDLLRLAMFKEVRASPRGVIAYTLAKNDLGANKVVTELRLIRDGAEHFIEVESPSGLRWSPDGSYLAFTGRRGVPEDRKGSGVYVWASGSDPRLVAWLEHGGRVLGWLSSEHLLIAYREPVAGLYDKDGDYVATDRLPLWFDSRGYVAGFKDVLGILAVGSGRLRALKAVENGLADAVPCGGRVYYAEPIDWRDPTTHKVVALDPTDGSEEVVAEGYDVGGLYCLCGRVFARMHRHEIGISSHYKLWSVEGPRCVTCGWLDRAVREVAGASKDGNPVIIYPDRGQAILAEVLDSELQILAGEEAYVHTAHTEGGVTAYVMSTPTQPEELYVLEGEGGKRVTSVNSWLAEEAWLAQPEHISIEAGGDKIDGWVMLPRGEGPHPMILYIHGGPKGMYGYRFMGEAQLMVSNGFAVAYANPRGSNGYSEEFADIRGRYGEVDYEQLMAFVDEVIRRYPIDPSRLGVTGISYGGYMTNVIITKTDRFAAAVPENGIGDWVSDYWASDIGYWFNPDQIGGTPLNNLEEYVRKSPAFRAANVKTPVLIIHSAEDYRCFIDQALAMHTALVMNHKESRLVVFKKGSHGHSIYAEPRHRRKRYELKLRWFKEKLGVAGKSWCQRIT